MAVLSSSEPDCGSVWCKGLKYLDRALERMLKLWPSLPIAGEMTQGHNNF